MTRYVNSSVTLNMAEINRLTRATVQALEMTGDYVLDDIVGKQVMPFDEGTLQNDSTFVDKKESKKGSVKISSTEPYARRLYYHPEYNFQTSNNPNAKGRWFDDYAQGGKYTNKVKKAYAGFLKQLGGIE